MMNSKDRSDRFLQKLYTNLARDWSGELTDILDQHAEEQRRFCFDRVKKVAIGMYFSSARMSDNEILSDFEDACLNATGEKE